MLLHILCNFTKEKAKQFQKIEYIRILGMNEIGRKYLNQQKKLLDLPLISKITREKPMMLEFELETTKIYQIPYPKEKKEEEKIIYKEEYND